LSISRLTRSLDCVVSFTNNFVCLRDQSSKQVIRTGCESHSLYHLCPSKHVGAVMKSPSLRHAQLGHPSLAKLHQLVPALSKLSHLVCESCQLGKHSRTSFPRSVTRGALSPFVVVHSNIWGPFIDDYSIFTWLFLMKNRSELFRIFEYFLRKLRLNLVFSLEFCAVIMVGNIFLFRLNILWLFTVFCIKLLVLIHLNKTV